MKGITPVIAIILLLLITISMVGFAFVWFSRVTQSATQSGSEQINTISQNAGKRITFEQVDATNDRVYVRIAGSSPVTPSEISVYVNDALMTAGTWYDSSCAAPAYTPTTQMTPNALVCYVPTGANPIQCPAVPFKIRMQAPGGFDETSC